MARLFPRLLLGILAVTVPLTVALALLLTDRSSQALRDQAESTFESAATVAAGKVAPWLRERNNDFDVLATRLPQLRGDRAGAGSLLASIGESDSYRGLAVTDAVGRVRLSTGATGPLATMRDSDWFRRARSGMVAFSTPARDGDGLAWYAASGLAGRDGRVYGVVVAHLDPAVLESFVEGAAVGRTGEAVLVSADRTLIATSTLGARPTVAEQLAGGVGATARSRANERALGGATGSLESKDRNGVDSISGYAPVADLGWGAVVKQAQREAYAPIHRQRDLAIVVALLGIAVAVAVAVVFARRTTRPLTDLQAAARTVAEGDLGRRVAPSGATEIRGLGEDFNAMVAALERMVDDTLAASRQVSRSTVELSAGAEELAAATAQQSAAAVETSATMEELSQTAASIADNVESVATQAAETRTVLVQAGDDVEASSARTLELARRVNDISAILDLINGIADRTSLLALNAAIEAARAGESGAGFTVVAEEVRRLADRSKESAGQIAAIVASTQAESDASVMAMELSAKHMRRGLELIEDVADAAGQARLTTDQQRTATAQVVQTMESVSAASRQTSATSRQIAASAATLSELAGGLAQSAQTTRGDHDARLQQLARELDSAPPVPV